MPNFNKRAKASEKSSPASRLETSAAVSHRRSQMSQSAALYWKPLAHGACVRHLSWEAPHHLMTWLHTWQCRILKK